MNSINLVSVIVPTFNRANTLSETIESVFNQTYRPIELLIIDDGSTDNTESIVIEFVRESKVDDCFEVQYLKQKNGGAPSARNKGIENAKGDYIQFLDSDDLLYPEKISTAINAYQKSKDIDLVYSGWIVSNQQGNFKNVGPHLDKYPFVAEVVLRYLWTSSPLYKKETIIKTGLWNTKLTRAQDREYCARCMQYVNKAIRIESFDCEYRQFVASNSITSTGHKPNPKHPMSGWIANKVMRNLVLKENHPELAPKALISLAKRDLKDARRAIACASPRLTRKILFSNKLIWKTDFKKAFFLLIISIVPGVIMSPIVNSITRFKMKYIHKSK